MTIKEVNKNTLLLIDGKFKTYVKKHKRGEKYILTCSCKVFQVTHECRHCAVVREVAPEKYVRNALNNVRMDEWFGNIQALILKFIRSLKY